MTQCANVYGVIYCKKSVTLKMVYNKKKIHFFGMNYAIFFHLVKRENVYFIRGFATHEICIFASLDHINGIFIPKMRIPSIYSVT